MQTCYLKLFYYYQRFILKFSLKNENQLFRRNFQGQTFYCQNKWSFLSAIKEIYIDECYKINKGIQIHSILDIGANLGFSIACFKTQYPHAHITAIEADPSIFELLKENMAVNKLSNVSLLNGAAWTCDGTLEFFQDHAQGGSLLQTEKHREKVKIEAFDIKKIVKSASWDLLKIDIEGAEIDIIDHISDCLKNFKLIFIEYHEDKNKIGQLSKILQALEENNFKYSLSPIFGSKNIFHEYKVNESFNSQLNIHAIRRDQIEHMI